MMNRRSMGVALPVILWDEGLHTFSSAKFHHGKEVAESDGKYYAINHHDGKYIEQMLQERMKKQVFEHRFVIDFFTL
jgi:hypothetical protein